MRRSFLLLALLSFGARALLRVAELDAHASIVAGMPVDANSSLWGPCTILVQLACILVAPVLLLAVGLDVLTRLASRARPSLPRPRSVGSPPRTVLRSER